MKFIDKLYIISMILTMGIWLSFSNAFNLVSYSDIITKPAQTMIYTMSLVLWGFWLNNHSLERIIRGPLFKSLKNGGVGSK